MKHVYYLLFFISIVSHASDVTELSIDSSTCRLKERGVAVKEKPISIQGKKTIDGCRAFITDKDFFSRFSYCVYSGFVMARGAEANYYSCRYSRELNSFMFTAHMSDEDIDRVPELVCNFMCYSE